MTGEAMYIASRVAVEANDKTLQVDVIGQGLHGNAAGSNGCSLITKIVRANDIARVVNANQRGNQLEGNRPKRAKATDLRTIPSSEKCTTRRSAFAGKHRVRGLETNQANLRRLDKMPPNSTSGWRPPRASRKYTPEGLNPCKYSQNSTEKPQEAADFSDNASISYIMLTAKSA